VGEAEQLYGGEGAQRNQRGDGTVKHKQSVARDFRNQDSEQRLKLMYAGTEYFVQLTAGRFDGPGRVISENGVICAEFETGEVSL
jgi:hypothetical protein